MWALFHVADAMELGVFTLLTLVVGLLLRPALACWRAYRLTRSIPGPPAYPLIGSFLALAGTQAELYDNIMALSARYGPTFKLWLGPVLAVVVTDPEDLQVVLSGAHTQRKAELMYSGSMEPFTGKGLVTINGPEYKRHRNAITPGFHTDVLHTFLPAFQAGAQRMVAAVERLLTGTSGCGRVDVAPLCGTCTAEAICETMLCAQPDPDRPAFAAATFKSAKLLFYRAMRPWLTWTPIFYWSAIYSEYTETRRVAHNFVSRILRQRLASQPAGKRLTLLDHLLQPTRAAAPRLRESELLGELKNIVWAGATTTADALSFLMYCLALRPDVQRRARQEVSEVLGDGGRDLLPADLPHLQYLERVIKEVLRYFAPSPVFAREPERDVALPSGHVLPRGCVVLVAPIITHKDPRSFPDPHAFEPDRFLPEAARARHPYAYIPFSAGARSCPSKRFAIMYLKTVAVTLLRRYEFSADPGGPQCIADIKPLLGTGLHVSGGACVLIQRILQPVHATDEI